jgi:hypothetical protein
MLQSLNIDYRTFISSYVHYKLFSSKLMSLFVLAGQDNLLNKTLLYDYTEMLMAGAEPGQLGLIIRRHYHADP